MGFFDKGGSFLVQQWVVNITQKAALVIQIYAFSNRSRRDEWKVVILEKDAMRISKKEDTLSSKWLTKASDNTQA